MVKKIRTIEHPVSTPTFIPLLSRDKKASGRLWQL